jgi:hypothetical protein
MRVVPKRGIAGLKHGGGNGFREPLGDRPPRGSVEGSHTGARVCLSRASDTATGQVLVNSGHVSTTLTALQGCQAF